MPTPPGVRRAKVCSGVIVPSRVAERDERLSTPAATLLATETDPASVLFAEAGLLRSLRSLLVHSGQISPSKRKITVYLAARTITTSDTGLSPT